MLERLLQVLGLVHAAYPPPSIWHSKVDPASVDVKEKLAFVWFVGLAGWLLMDVSGAAVSIAQE